MKLRLVMVPLGCACWICFGWSLEDVSVGGGRFRISNGFRAIEVPVTHLIRTKKDASGMMKSVTLFFKPPTALGRKIDIKTASGNFANVARILDAILKENGELSRNNRGADSEHPYIF